jgi:ABC-type transporter Mla subunit MlaD
MENILDPTTADQVSRAAKDAQKLGSEVRKDFGDAVSRGKDAVGSLADDAAEQARKLSGRAREYADSARRNLGKAAGKVSAYADDNTAIVAVASFGIGVLVGYLVTRES